MTKQRAALAAIDRQKKQITDRFTGPTQPTGANAVKLLNQLFALGEKRKAALDSFCAALGNDKKGHDDIRNPIDNILAGVRYAVHVYGSISNVPGIVSLHRGGRDVGY